MSERLGRLAGRVALVTGAASRRGIGFAVAGALSREGAAVMVTDLSDEPLAARVAELRAAGGDALSSQHDITLETSWTHVLDMTAGRLGPADILVNNAGIAVLEPIETLSIADFERVVHINLTGAFIGCKLMVEQLRARRAPGSIINMSSVAGLVGVKGAAGYGSAKAGLRLLTKTIALEAGRDGIRCNSVHPGAIWTDIQDAAVARAPETYGDIASAIPLGYVGDPTDVASAVLFLASDESRYVTGAELVVDGGLTAA